MKTELTQENISKAEELFQSNENFTCTVLPRLKLLYAIKKELKTLNDLRWFFEFNHVNVNQNRVIIEYVPSFGTEFNLFYEIPLSQKFELQAFLGNSSVHFIDIYNYLLETNHIKENQFVIHAEYRKIPHFILNLNVKRYQLRILNHYLKSETTSFNLIDEVLLEEMRRSFDDFNPKFKLVIDSFHKKST